MRVNDIKKRYEVNFNRADLPKNYSYAYTLGFILRNKMSMEDATGARRLIEYILNKGEKTLRNVCNYRNGAHRGRLEETEKRQIEELLGIEDGALDAQPIAATAA